MEEKKMQSIQRWTRIAGLFAVLVALGLGLSSFLPALAEAQSPNPEPSCFFRTLQSEPELVGLFWHEDDAGYSQQHPSADGTAVVTATADIRQYGSVGQLNYTAYDRFQTIEAMVVNPTTGWMCSATWEQDGCPVPTSPTTFAPRFWTRSITDGSLLVQYNANPNEQTDGFYKLNLRDEVGTFASYEFESARGEVQFTPPAKGVEIELYYEENYIGGTTWYPFPSGSSRTDTVTITHKLTEIASGTENISLKIEAESTQAITVSSRLVGPNGEINSSGNDVYKLSEPGIYTFVSQQGNVSAEVQFQIRQEEGGKFVYLPLIRR
jgi:hypothetical protein